MTKYVIARIAKTVFQILLALLLVFSVMELDSGRHPEHIPLGQVDAGR